jgi:putative restriction endonuclease
MAGNLLQRFDDIRMFARGGRLAPHKPLLLLYALARLKNEKIERISFSEAEKSVGPLIRTYGPFGPKANVAYPFARLANDRGKFWWVEEHDRTPAGDLSLAEARDRDLKAGFTEDVLRAFRDDPGLIDLLALNLLERNFPPSLHSDLLEAVGLHLGEDEVEAFLRRKRDPRFRANVLAAYYEQCAICRYDLRINGAPVGLDAAHIKMHAAGGPDEVCNGLALCALHHKLFDLGALTVDPAMKVLVSDCVVGDWGRRLQDDLDGRSIALPRSVNLAPASEYLRWHNRFLFKRMAGQKARSAILGQENGAR